MLQFASNRIKVPMNIFVFLALIFAGSQARLESAVARNESALQCRCKAAALEHGRCGVDAQGRKGVKAVPFPIVFSETPGLALAPGFQGVCDWARELPVHCAGERGGCNERAPPAAG